MIDSTIHTNAPEVVDVLMAAFPEYKGRTFRLRPLRFPFRLDSYWDGGSRSYYRFVNLAGNKKVATEVPKNGTQSSREAISIDTLPPGVAIAEHSIFRGKDHGLILHVLPENINQRMLPASVELTWAERVVLTATRSLKSSYAGIRNYRYHEAKRYTGITLEQYERAKANLIAKGLLNKAGAIANDGRNAIGMTALHELAKPTDAERNRESELPTPATALESERAKAAHAIYEQHDAALSKRKPPTPPQESRCMGEADLPVPRATLTQNHVHNSWELTFERKPPRWVLDALKQRKWRWSRRKACWYKHRSRSTDATARTNDDALALNFVYQFLSDDQRRKFCGEEHAA